MDSTPEPPQLDPAVLALSSAPTDVQLLDPSTSPIQSCSVANSSDALNSITTAAPTTTVLQAPRVAAQVPLESSAMGKFFALRLLVRAGCGDRSDTEGLSEDGDRCWGSEVGCRGEGIVIEF